MKKLDSDEMNKLEELIEEAEKRRIIYLDDFVDFINPYISAENLRHCIYEIIRKRDQKRPTLADAVSLKK